LADGKGSFNREKHNQGDHHPHLGAAHLVWVSTHPSLWTTSWRLLIFGASKNACPFSRVHCLPQMARKRPLDRIRGSNMPPSSIERLLSSRALISYCAISQHGLGKASVNELAARSQAKEYTPEAHQAKDSIKIKETALRRHWRVKARR
jgi:hypothetical protein